MSFGMIAIASALGGFILKGIWDRNKEKSNIRKTLEKYEKIDNMKEVDGEALLKGGINAKKPRGKN